MLEIPIPGSGTLRLARLVLDYNGTLAKDGVLLPGVRERMDGLADRLEIVVLTADTFGSVHEQLAGARCRVLTLPPAAPAPCDAAPEDQAKARILCELGADQAAFIGNGRNDRLALKAAALSMAVLQAEGACFDALAAAQVIAPDILSALDLLRFPRRLTATLRL